MDWFVISRAGEVDSPNLPLILWFRLTNRAVRVHILLIIHRSIPTALLIHVLCVPLAVTLLLGQTLAIPRLSPIPAVIMIEIALT